MLEQISQLTPEQEALIPVYREKWQKMAISTEPIHREKAANAIKAAYEAIALPEPEIIFYDSPYTALIKLGDARGDRLANTPDRGKAVRLQIESRVLFPIKKQLEDQVAINVRSKLRDSLYFPPQNELETCLESIGDLAMQCTQQLSEKIPPELWAVYSSLYDYYIGALNCQYSDRAWDLFHGVVSQCGWLFPYEKVCVVCDRPRELYFDEENHLHAEGFPAIVFADGFNIYAYHGVILPEKYGKIYPEKWQSEWIFSEENAELRRVLIQGIGYDRLCQELQATELDYWQGYSLLRIDKTVDIEPINLLKMNCPSTNYIHVLRVPPDIELAREAIKWVNWGIDPKEFSVQS